LLIVGLAPGLKGANRTGRPFTGDYAGDLLYATMLEFGFARGVFAARPDDGLQLVDAMIANAVRLPFTHGGRHEIARPGKSSLRLFDSYHCSRYNTNTGVLTTDMFRSVFRDIRAFIDAAD
jgi:uracil-DNA glycosylase